jgi:hypothetical protein
MNWPQQNNMIDLRQHAVKTKTASIQYILEATIEAAWAATAKAAIAAVNMWVSHHLPTRTMKKVALETFVFSKLWYLAGILPLPTPVAQKLARADGTGGGTGHLLPSN